MKLVLIANQLVGVVVNKDRKTLLIRKTTTFYDSEDKKRIGLADSAVYVNEDDLLAIDAKFVELKQDSIEAANAQGGSELVFKLLNM